jgi:hypothetical protein
VLLEINPREVVLTIKPDHERIDRMCDRLISLGHMPTIFYSPRTHHVDTVQNYYAEHLVVAAIELGWRTITVSSREA